MKALVLTAYNHLEIQDWPQPEVAADEVLLRVAACGICGSDIHGMDGSTGRRQPPLIMGHEAAGTVEKVGGHVQGWKPGDRATFDSTVYCGTCWYCRRGEINLCDRRRVLGVSCDDYRRHGAFAQYVTVPQHILVHLPESVSFRQAAMIEPLSIAFHAVRRTNIALGDTAVVIGSGMIGLLVVQSLRASGCGRIIAVDVDRRRLDMACKLGATEGLPSEAVATRRRKSSAEPAAAGPTWPSRPWASPSTLQMAIACVRKGGQVTLVGNLAPSTAFPLQAVVTREADGTRLVRLLRRVSGLPRHDRPPHDRRRCARSARPAPLSEGPAWFERLQRGGEGFLKVILEP